MTEIRYSETDSHRWEITDADGQVAELLVDIDTHEVLNIWTRQNCRGQGLARALWDAANAQFEIFHGPVAHRTPEGDAFAVAVGGRSVTACIVGGCAACDPIDDEEF